MAGVRPMNMKHNLEVVETMLDEIEQHPDNANNGDTEALRESIETNGFFSPVIVQSSTGYIIAGNHRYQVASELGMVTIPAIFLDVDDEQAKRMMLADNRITRLGHDDPSLLLNLLEDLSETDLGLLGTGFSHKELQNLQDLADSPLEFLPEPEPEPEPVSQVTGIYHVEPDAGDENGVSSLTVVRKDGEYLTAKDLNRVRMALGLHYMGDDEISELGIESWGG